MLPFKLNRIPIDSKASVHLLTYYILRLFPGNSAIYRVVNEVNRLRAHLYIFS